MRHLHDHAETHPHAKSALMADLGSAQLGDGEGTGARRSCKQHSRLREDFNFLTGPRKAATQSELCMQTTDAAQLYP